MELGSTVSAVKSTRVFLGNQQVGPAVILIRDGKIHQVLSSGEVTEGVLDAGDSVVMPGIVDCHVHVNEPGRTSWEGFWTATRAAAAGGITTIVDMPLNSIPPTTTLANLQAKLRETSGKCFVDTAFWGGVIPGNQLELQPMIQAGVAGFKCFLIQSGVDEFPHVSHGDLLAALEQLRGTGTVLLFHAEKEVQLTNESNDPQQYDTFLQSRPDIMEVEAIRSVIQLCIEYQVRCHVVHLSSSQALPVIQEAKKGGASLTVETTHHYLSLSAENVPAGATQFKCCPPIRSAHNQDQLWAALKAGHIDMVVSDHSPCTADLKKLDSGDFTQAWGGISSLQFGLPLFWSLASQKGFQFGDAVRLLCQNTARLCGLGQQKGSLAPGYDADLVIWDPEREFEVCIKSIHHKNKITPYLGMSLRGVVRSTIVRGHLVYRDGSFSAEPLGKTVLIPSRTTPHDDA
uniref:allantoinase n=1 Tax=Hippocampus comes TaxID=109280 RepID=A0A3Q2YZQ6_HIPCM